MDDVILTPEQEAEAERIGCNPVGFGLRKSATAPIPNQASLRILQILAWFLYEIPRARPLIIAEAE